VIASDGGYSAFSSIHLGTFQTGMCFKTTADYGLRPQIKANGRLTQVFTRRSILLSPTDFWLRDDGTMGVLEVAHPIEYNVSFAHPVANFNDYDRPNIGGGRMLIATIGFPNNFFKPQGATGEDFSIRVRFALSYTQGNSHIIPIGFALRYVRAGTSVNNPFGGRTASPLTTQPIDPNDVFVADFTIPPSDFPNSPINGGSLVLRIRRVFVQGESDIVRLLGAEITYPALL